MLLLRHIRHGAALSAAAFIFCAANLHAAWNLKYPFYHVDQPPASTATAVPAPTIQPPAEMPVELPEVPKESAAGTSSLPTPVIVSPVIAIQPESPVPASLQTSAEDPWPKRRPAEFDGAKRIPATVFTEDTIWQEKVQLDGWITIAPQATLTIAPGTIVRVAARCGINVLGRIVVKGTIVNPVVVTSLNSESIPGDWKGIVLTGSEKKNIIENLRIEGAETGLLARYSSFSTKGITISRAVTGLHLQECVVEMTDCRINDSEIGITAEFSELTIAAARIETNRSGITLKNSALVSSDTILAGNRTIGLGADDSRLELNRFQVTGSETGIRISGCEGSVSDSVFSDNTEAGAILSGSRLRVNGNRFSGNRIGLQVDDHLPVLWNNALFNNKSYNLLYMGEENYFAGGNWFGDGERGTVARTQFSRRAGALQSEPILETNPVEND